MPKSKKLNRPPLQFINEPFSKPKGETVYKTCSEVYPEVKRALTDDAYVWFEPCFKTLQVKKERTLSRSSSNARQYLPELQFLPDGQIAMDSLSCVRKQKSCPLFPLKSPEVITREVVVLVKETPENTNRMTRKCSHYNPTVNGLFEQLPGCNEDALTIKK
ncbi:unnamed protein product [Schistosoma turkestanicum]|nr:unnamed protein product [Schistosoma turkestanicum]